MQNEKCWLENECKKLHCNDPQGCLIKYKLNYLYDEAGIPENKRKTQELFTDLDGTDRTEFIKLKQIQNNILDFVNSGSNLYIYSLQAGNGKTSWSLRLAQAYLKKIWLKSELKCRVLFISVPSFLLALKANISEPNEYYKHINENVLNCDLVIWDDIGSKIGTEFEISHLLSIIDARINMGKANIYTSNVLPEQLGNLLDIRLGSRIANASTCIQFKGGDKRSLTLGSN